MDQSSLSSSTQRPGIKRVSSPIGAPEEPRLSKMNRQEEPEAPIPEEHPRNPYEQQLFLQRWERERVSYYAGIYDPQHEFPHQVNHIIQIGQIRDFYEELMLAGMDSCPRDAENFRLVEIANIWDLRNEKGKEEVRCDNRTVEYNTPSYKILAACDFYFLMRMPTLSLKRLGNKIDPLPDNMPQGDVRFVDISMLKIITGLISDKKPNRLRVTKLSYMFSRESDILDEAPIQLDLFTYLLEDRELKTVKLRAWDDRMVLQANNYPNMVRNCLMRRHSVHCALPRWTNVETLDIRDEIVFMAQYTVICSQDLDHDEIVEAYIRSDIQGKFENHPALGFPLKHTRIKGDGNTYVLEMIPKQIKVTVRPTMEDD
ncbi:Protein CBG15046 [Caenorhabditis briggsae]|uniref:Protein CBG15046 n=1 Tax=Caenorhabditis briggsae TaxID=6238 RepID=A8XL99_CAEBR|nr:Protein CBG15046 [Caenorhabditis briggsae]CAP33424.1 Protein CBG15046 [Caenorhabditis briggsae]